ncbi:MAG: hypothetical protein M0D54_07910 [Hyphomonadaceae bacterium JAD_PAG50586_4]|nr:MAG: hypothetical protein M0D54_07910 [Hyphomonadaceae bacterium JAD_PAG50586_4]
MFFAESLGAMPRAVTPNALLKLIKLKMAGRASVSSEELFAIVTEVVSEADLRITPEAAIEFLANAGKLNFETNTNTARVEAA